LYNLSANRETRTALNGVGGLQALTLVAKDADIECWRYITIALCNLANSPQTQVEVIVHGGLAPITAINNSAANEGNQTVMFGKDVVKRVIQLAQSLDLVRNPTGTVAGSRRCHSIQWISAC
jgi:hypothetical protein